MHVEDFLLAIADAITVNQLARRPTVLFGGLFDDAWNRRFISSVTQHVRADRPVSSKQSRTILKLIGNASSYLVAYGIASQSEIDAALRAPTHRQPPYTSAQVPREARYVGDNLIAVRCKADPLVINAIKALGQPPSDTVIGSNLLRARPRFDWTHKIWLIPVFRFNLRAIKTLLLQHRFHLDQAITDYLARCAVCADAAAYVNFADAERSVLRAEVADDYLLARWCTEVASGVAL